MAEDEVCLLEADEALGFFAEVNEGVPRYFQWEGGGLTGGG